MATNDVHQRLHSHRGFAAVQDGTISRANYAKLLIRLEAFHIAFEAAARIGNQRSNWLAQDIGAVLGTRWLPGAAAHRPTIPLLDSNERVLGALYVVEGSALGGIGLARGLDSLLGSGVSDGRRFFAGRGSVTGSAWRDFIARLDLVSVQPAARLAAIDAAVATFSVFEVWLADWRKANVGRN